MAVVEVKVADTHQLWNEGEQQRNKVLCGTFSGEVNPISVKAKVVEAYQLYQEEEWNE